MTQPTAIGSSSNPHIATHQNTQPSTDFYNYTQWFSLEGVMSQVQDAVFSLFQSKDEVEESSPILASAVSLSKDLVGDDLKKFEEQFKTLPRAQQKEVYACLEKEGFIAGLKKLDSLVASSSSSSHLVVKAAATVTAIAATYFVVSRHRDQVYRIAEKIFKGVYRAEGRRFNQRRGPGVEPTPDFHNYNVGLSDVAALKRAQEDSLREWFTQKGILEESTQEFGLFARFNTEEGLGAQNFLNRARQPRTVVQQNEPRNSLQDVTRFMFRVVQNPEAVAPQLLDQANRFTRWCYQQLESNVLRGVLTPPSNTDNQLALKFKPNEEKRIN